MMSWFQRVGTNMVQREQGFTILDRLREVIRTEGGRDHLRRTWRFAAQQAFRAASGRQISDVLAQLSKLGGNLQDSLQMPPNPSISVEAFSSLAQKLGAGKRSGHEFVYKFLDFPRDSPLNILEVGIGTNDPKVPSNMGKDGNPGSSLEMWTEIFPNSTVIGADVDPSCLVETERICSFLLDSTDPQSILELKSKLEKFGGLDLIVDDGLHTPESNLALLIELIPMVKVGGFYVVEDIPSPWSGFWRVVAMSFSENFETRLVSECDSVSGSYSFLILKRVR